MYKYNIRVWYYRLQCSKWRIKMSRSNILLGLQSKLWKKCTKDSAGKGLFVKYKVYVHVSVATISTCRNSLDFTFLPIFTFISGILAATCNLKIMKTGPPSAANVWKSSTSSFFPKGPMENRTQVNSIAGSFLHHIPKVAGYQKKTLQSRLRKTGQIQRWQVIN